MSYELDDIFKECGLTETPVDDLSDINIMSDINPIDLPEIDSASNDDATEIVSRLAGYFFDEEYVQLHPYIPTKIKTVTEVIRRTVKMLKTNEAAQDALVRGISLDPTKASLFTSLTALQNSAGALQKQLNEHISELENIFQKMEDHTERTFAVKDKDNQDGINTVRGAREFIMKMKGELE